jgi:DNA mismatch repair protein MutS
MEKLTPMLKQYMDVKQSVPDALVLFRLGDFYELFFEDAKVASAELDLVLTARAAGEMGKAPMCGVPYHAVSTYIQKLVNNGHKVAIVEQLEDPALAKGLVKRDIVKIVTPGTVLDEISDETSIVRCAAIEEYAGKLFIVMTELASGELLARSIVRNMNQIRDVILHHAIKEVVVPSSLSIETLSTLQACSITITTLDQNLLQDSFEGLARSLIDPIKRQALSRLLTYLSATQRRALSHLRPVSDLDENTVLRLDYATTLNLELVEPLRNGAKKETLFTFLDQCQTAAGSRRLKRWIVAPLVDSEALQTRQAQVDSLVKAFLDRESLRAALKSCYDIERICGKLAYGSATPVDVLRLSKTLNQVDLILDLLNEKVFASLKTLDRLHDLRDLLSRAIDEEAPLQLTAGPVFKRSYNAELDAYRDLQDHSASWLVEFEAAERERTQIKNLRVGYNRVFGYYIEISKGNLGLVKDEFGYFRKQTLSTGERYISPILKEKEEAILSANDKALRLTQRLFAELVETLTAQLEALQTLSDALATIDVIAALAEVSHRGDYVKPVFHDGFDLKVKDGRHPILERRTAYVANGIDFDAQKPIHLLTGPNMGGKSTYMRQVALIVILAQLGMYVPATSASLPIVDAIYTRMGASDDILEGQSTFMIEMMEANTALQHATSRSLILFDEIGRGTSTYDGMALAQAMVEYIATAIGCKAIFSTHYHELTNLDTFLPGVLNTHVEVIEDDKAVHFLYRVKHGKADKSYGVNVARLAHLPESVLDRAAILLKELESKKRVVQQTLDIVEVVRVPRPIQAFLDRLNTMDLDQTTPLEALRVLSEVKADLKGKP